MQLVGVETAEIAQEVSDVTECAVESFGDRVDLGTVARTEHDRLANIVARYQPGDCLALLVRPNGEPFEQ